MSTPGWYRRVDLWTRNHWVATALIAAIPIAIFWGVWTTSFVFAVLTYVVSVAGSLLLRQLGKKIRRES